MKSITGIVTSSKMKDTIVITVHKYKLNEKYKKKYRTSKKFYAHDEGNKSKEGDTVTVYETRPLSKLKRWTVTKPEVKKTIK